MAAESCCLKLIEKNKQSILARFTKIDKSIVKMIADIITISKDVQSGTPVFTGTRVPVKNLCDYLRGGDTIQEFLHDFPSVKKEQVGRLLELVENLITLTPYEEKAAA